MATTQSTGLPVARREVAGSRAVRRLRRTGSVPGILYGGGEDPVAFQVDARLLRQTLSHAGAVLDLSVDGGGSTPVVVKELTRHPVTGETIHVDLLRVRLDQAITATVVLDLVGGDDAPGVKEGGVLTQETREVTVEALPGDIPDVIGHDASGLEMNATLTLDAIRPPRGVKLVDDPETVVATITPPTAEPVEEEIETETELVGEGEEGEAQAEGDTAEEAEQSAQDSSDGD